MKVRRLPLFFAACLATSGVSEAVPQYFSYTATRNAWTGANWAGSSGGSYTGNWGGYNDAVLEGSGGTVSGGGAVNTWTFNADGYVLTGGFTMGSPGTANFLIGNAAHTATISGNLGRANDSNVLWKDGAGKLVLGGINTPYKMVIEQGSLEVSGGSTTISNGFSVGRDSFGTSLADVGTFKISGGSVTLNAGDFFMGQTVNGSTKVAQFTQTGGFFAYNNASGFMGIANGGGVSQIDLSGGSFTSAAAMSLGVRNNSSLNVSGNADVNLPSIRIFWSDAVTGSGKTGSVNLDGGTLTTGQIFQSSGVNTSVITFNGGTLKARSSNGAFLGGLTTATVKAGGAKIDTNTFDITITQSLLHDATLGATPDGGLTKSNTGALTLNGTHSYTGATTVSGGKLVINGNVSTSLLTTVKSGATLGGTGTVGALTVDSGGIIAPGNSAGNLTSTGDLTLAGTYTWELAALSIDPANFDRITMTSGNANLSGANLALSLGLFNPSEDPFWQSNQTWNGILNNSGSGTLTGMFGAIDNTAWASLGSFSTVAAGNDVSLVWTAIPEPTSFFTAPLLGSVLLIRRRR